ncbi:MAG: hypothetical protein K9K66_11245 [Desulfarculaceae bacterium]|nr:hypothetical protein [Desulfarculaceae bacterium]MCF8070785.1 hypothetical protein [Desulfarculaceae bacterium]MCF8102222.1 hypothetical protein [Desulfarculaceae bacterium]MCF8116979.1 hypothetical protein [Desulfarculaceae bacterium]
MSKLSMARMFLLAAALALALLAAGACGGAGPDSPDAKSLEYEDEGWCYRWVPQGEADLDKAREYCKKRVLERRKYLGQTLGKQAELGPTSWNQEACLKILGWERCPQSDFESE